MAAEMTDVLGHAIPPTLSETIRDNRGLSLWDEGLLVAMIGTGVASGATWLVSMVIPFVPKMPGADADMLRILVRVGLFLSLIGSLLGMVVHIRYRFLLRKPTPDDAAMHQLVACHRLQAAFLLLLVSLGAIVHSWNLNVWLGGISTLVVGLQLVMGYHKLPQRLGYVVHGPSGGTAKAVSIIEVLLPILLVMGVGGPLINYAGPPSSFAALMNVMGLIGARFIFSMLAVASIHLQAARADVQ